MNAQSLSGVGRREIESKLHDALAEVACLHGELEKATTKIHEDAWVIHRAERRVTELQTRGTELIEEARVARRAEAGMRLMLDIHPLAPLLVALDSARKKHPGGPDGLRSLMEEVGEVANAMRRETPDRVREELLDVAVVALRMYLGETQESR